VIPWNIVALVLGYVVFFANTSLGRSVRVEAMESMKRYFQLQTSFISKERPYSSSSRASNLLDSESVTAMVECFENQRWWAGLGWIAHLLRKERAPWSNKDGEIVLKSKNEIDSAQHWITMGATLLNSDKNEKTSSQWTTLGWDWVPGSKWRLDTTWVDPEEQKVDADGWVYSDPDWQPIAKTNQAMSLTRRRRWIKPVVLVLVNEL
jgi:hypothetical protein